MITTCVYDKYMDTMETVPGLDISIEMAMTTGVVKDTCDTTPYSKMESTEEVMGYLKDPIDIALEARRVGEYINNSYTQSTTEGVNGNPEGAE